MNEEQHPTSEAPHAVPSRLIHDLRTPLNQIIGYSELLIEQRREEDPADLTTDLQKIRVSAKQLLALINDNFHPTSAPKPAAIVGSLAKHPARSATEPRAEALLEIVTTSPGTASAGQGMVLVVDDIEANRDVLTRRLERQGIRSPWPKTGDRPSNGCAPIPSIWCSSTS